MAKISYDLIIIGAGPSGLVAGLYAGRYRLNTLILERIAVGGQIILSHSIENFPGFPGGIATSELIERFKKQVDDLNIPIKREEVLGISPRDGIYNIKTKDGNYETKSVIIASGTQPRPLGVGGEDRLIGRGVSYCGTCDGPLFKNKEIVVVGGGDRAIEEAIFLSGYASKVSLIHRRQGFRASKILEESAKNNPRINFILESVIEEIVGQNKVEGVKIRSLANNSLRELGCQGVFIFVGITPNTAFVKGQLQMDEAGFIITDEDLNTSLKGIFACGDCRKKSLYQVINGCGEGAQAAHSVHKYLQ